jgi:hypothetical protein
VGRGTGRYRGASKREGLRGFAILFVLIEEQLRPTALVVTEDKIAALRERLRAPGITLEERADAYRVNCRSSRSHIYFFGLAWISYMAGINRPCESACRAQR